MACDGDLPVPQNMITRPKEQEIKYFSNVTGTDSSGNELCSGDTSGSCAIFPNNYYVSGCVLRHSIPLYSTWAGIAGLLALLYTLDTIKYWIYTT
jgi:hypothetical protein